MKKDKFVERRKQREINRMSKDNLYKLLDGTDYMKNPDKLDEYRDTKNKMFETVSWFELETMSLNQFLKTYQTRLLSSLQDIYY